MRSLTSLLLGLLLTLAAPLQATTIQPFTLAELAKEAELIFQGRVLERRSEREDGMVYTWVRFQADEVLKGAVPAAEFELRFVGGSSQGMEVSVAELDIPSAGEEGIYFVESLTRPLLNPLLGWSQGHYLIEQSAGDALVSNRRGQWPQLQSPAEDVQALKSGRSAQALSKPLEGPQLADDFKDLLRGLLQGAAP